MAVATPAIPRPAEEHCGSEQGPVTTAAHQAVEKGNVKLILPYVKPEAENERTAAFKQTLAVRKAGGDAKELADRYLIETAIRLHREGEGAPYTGVTDETTPKSILVADKAMATGSRDTATKNIESRNGSLPMSSAAKTYFVFSFIGVNAE